MSLRTPQRLNSRRAFPIVYLHGLASGPFGNKARVFKEGIIPFENKIIIPDFNQDDFEHLTISRALGQLEEEIKEFSDVLLIGSSFGGYVAALATKKIKKVKALVLLAPAFDFAARWQAKFSKEALARWKSDGVLPVFHYASNKEEKLNYEIVEDAKVYSPFPKIDAPMLIIHGKADDTVDPEVSRKFSALHPSATLELIDSDHQLSESTDWVVDRSLRFLSPWLLRKS